MQKFLTAKGTETDICHSQLPHRHQKRSLMSRCLGGFYRSQRLTDFIL